MFLNKVPIITFLSGYGVGFSRVLSYAPLLAMAKKPKKKTLKYWKTKIDKPFHEFIRRRDADNNSGYCKCISCNKPIHFTESDAGHFIGRQHLATRWDERNVNSQCRKCNRFEYGRQFEYSLNLGEELSNELLQKSRGIMKLADFEYMEIFEEFKAKLQKLKEIQNF